MTRKELSARAADVKRAIASPGTCTPATVESLRAFLLPVNLPNQYGKDRTVTIAVPKAKTSGQRETRNTTARARKQPAVAIEETSNENNIHGKPQDRWALATEIVNLTLHTLSEAGKHSLPPQKNPFLRRSSSTTSTKDGMQSRSETPLQPISVNKITRKPSESGLLQRSSSKVFLQETSKGLKAQAECGRIAFAALRSLQGMKGIPAMPHLQIESGMSALIARFINLGFDDLAMRELRILRRCLEASTEPLPRDNGEKSFTNSNSHQSAEPNKETLSDLLQFSNIDGSEKCLSLIVATQLQILRLLISESSEKVIEAAVGHLQLQVSHSPANLIQQQIKAELAETRIKAIHQQESLAQTLTAVAKGSSAAQGGKGSNTGECIGPHIAFQYQLLALQIRAKWWGLPKHQINYVKEIGEPFIRCLSSLKRRPSLDATSTYRIAEQSFHTFAALADEWRTQLHEAFLSVYQILADLAQDSNQYFEALAWINKAHAAAKMYEVSPAKMCTLTCRLANLQIKTTPRSAHVHLKQYLHAASAALDASLQGISAELDELLVAVASLRRSAFSVFQDGNDSPSTGMSPDDGEVVTLCVELVLRSVKFLLRYIGNGSIQEGSMRTTTRRTQRLGLALQVAYPFVECLAVMARLSSKADSECWARLEAGLRDCRTLALALEGDVSHEHSIPNDQKRLSPFVSLSNAYWLRYLHVTQGQRDNGRTRGLIQNAVDLLKNRSAREKRDGCLISKFEKYGQDLESTREYCKSLQMYGQALRTGLDIAKVSKATKCAEGNLTPFASVGNSDLVRFSRVLKTYSKAALRATEQGNDVSMVFDCKELDAGDRGFMLEQQILSLLSISRSGTTAKAAVEALNTVVRILLSVYTREIYPVRRLRVVVRLLNFLSAKPGSLDRDIQEEIIREPSSCLTHSHLDLDLMQTWPFLNSFWKVITEFCQESWNLENIEEVLASWSRMLQDSPTWDLLQPQVYDMSEWILLLEFMVAYLDMQGLGMTRVSVLHLLVSVSEISETESSSLASKIISLGLQYSRLGYCGIATSTLCKAQKHMETSGAPAEVTLTWHFACAENAMYCGNPRSW